MYDIEYNVEMYIYQRYDSLIAKEIQVWCFSFLYVSNVKLGSCNKTEKKWFLFNELRCQEYTHTHTHIQLPSSRAPRPFKTVRLARMTATATSSAEWSILCTSVWTRSPRCPYIIAKNLASVIFFKTHTCFTIKRYDELRNMYRWEETLPEPFLH